MSSVPNLPACLISVSFLPPGFSCFALPTSDISLASDLWTFTLFLPPDHHLLLNPWICQPESASLCLNSLLCFDYQFKPSSWILSPVFCFPALTQFLSPYYHILSTPWVSKPEVPSLCELIVAVLGLIIQSSRGVLFTVPHIHCDVTALPPTKYTKESKINFHALPRILRRGS
ncbi:hypothetical protein ILYODFUR_034797 [Ilyodon furcidens]|uniref:Uncharacterized protein n=1 Tax=Ilyodon furcidens TaxID=33524 RepID=A0ABV0ULK8_9TELE